MFKKSMVSLASALFLMGSAGFVQAQTTEKPTADDQAIAQTATANRDRADERDFDWGWLGLIGLLGLAGLTGRTRDTIETRRATNVRT